VVEQNHGCVVFIPKKRFKMPASHRATHSLGFVRMYKTGTYITALVVPFHRETQLM